MIDKYTPNLSDPRVLSRLTRAYAFVLTHASPDKSRQLHTRQIDKHFGQSTTAISKFLRSLLLTCTHQSYSIKFKKCKRYVSNPRGLEWLGDQLLQHQPLVEDIAQGKAISIPRNYAKKHVERPILPGERAVFDDFLIRSLISREFETDFSSGVFNYTDKADRLWHPLQNMRRNEKKLVLAANGFNHDYDVQACAPTLLLQLARKRGLKRPTPILDAYLEDRGEFRDYIAGIIEVDTHTAKIVVNAFFCGAKLGATDQFALFRLLDRDEARIEMLRIDPRVAAFRKEIAKMWMKLGHDVRKNHRERIDPETGEITVIRTRKTSRIKWELYFRLERQVLDSTIDFLKATGVAFFLQHDGFTANGAVDVVALQAHLRAATGFDLQHSYEYLTVERTNPTAVSEVTVEA